MQSFKSFLAESTKEVPFDKNPHVGWWKDKAEKDGYHTVYHGTHKKNLDSILKHGLNHRDPHTGMISVTHDPHTAHGYAAMSGSGGERNFRKAGAKAVHTPHEDRVVLKMHIPKEFVDKHMDHDFHGNPKHGNRTKMADKSHYDSWKKSNPDKPDHEFYQVSELRLNKEIPHHYIVGYSHKVKKWLLLKILDKPKIRKDSWGTHIHTWDAHVWIWRRTLINFYEKCAEMLNAQYEGEPFKFYKRTRWNNRKAGQGRYPGFGTIKHFGSFIQVNLYYPVNHTKSYKNEKELFTFLESLCINNT